MSRFTAATTALFVTMMLSTSVHAAPSAPAKAAPMPATAKPAAPALARAIFAGGCFWCEETAFEGLPGVQSAISGYTGGTKLNPT